VRSGVKRPRYVVEVRRTPVPDRLVTFQLSQPDSHDKKNVVKPAVFVAPGSSHTLTTNDQGHIGSERWCEEPLLLQARDSTDRKYPEPNRN
jgi:hypothetical protein